MKPEVTAIDSSSRCPLRLLAGSALLWLVLSGALALTASVQRLCPAFMAECPVFTHGRLQSMAESAFVYGWLANAGLAVSLWILARLGGESLRAQNWALVGGAFWNLAVFGGLVGTAFGDGTSVPLLGLPTYVQPILFFSYGAIAVAGILAWCGRSREVSHAAQWYAVAPLFLFPWIFSLAQLMLFWHPVRGVVQAVVAGWYAQAAWTLWLAPLSLAVAYYVIPKVNGKTLKAYEFSILGFWSLLFIGAWTGGRHLIGGPVPAWISAIAVVSCVLLLFHYLVVLINLSGGFTAGATSTRFISAGLVAYLLVGLADAVTGFHGVALYTQFTYVDEAIRQLAFYGAASLLLFGGIYFAVPRITGRAWRFAWLIRGHWLLTILGIVLLVGGLAWAGLVQGHDLVDPVKAGEFASFATIAADTHLGLLLSSAGWAILLLGNILFFINFILTLCPCRQDGEAQFEPPMAMEASAS